MAAGTTVVTPRDGGIGFTGPDGRSVRAAVGVAAIVPADNVPPVVTSAADAHLVLGRGPLRDFAVVDLTCNGGTMVTVPLPRAAGGTPIAAAAITDGSLSVLPQSTGYSLGQEHVVLEVVTGGAAGTAAFRFIVDGIPGDPFTPTEAELVTGGAAADYQPPQAALGLLAAGVPRASQLTVQLSLNGSASAYVVGDSVSWRMSEPTADGASLAQAVSRLANHAQPWSDLTNCGVASGSAIEMLDAAIRQLWQIGRFVFAGVQLAGPDQRTGALADQSTAAWGSTVLGVDTYVGGFERKDSPTTSLCNAWLEVRDPITQRLRVMPGLYVYMALVHQRRAWEPPDAVKHGRAVTDPRNGNQLLEVRRIYPYDLAENQELINAMDSTWFTTFTTYSGRQGVYLTHGRMWGEPGGDGRRTSDYDAVERRRVMDLSAAVTRVVLWPFQNDTVTTDRNGFMSESAKEHWRTVVLGAFSGLLALGAITAIEVIVEDMAPGVLRRKRVKVTVRVTPLAKVEDIEADVFFYVAASGPALVDEEAA